MRKNKPSRPVAKPLFATPKTVVNPATSPQLINQQLEKLNQNFKQALSQKDFSQAVKFASQAHQLIPQSPIPLSDMAACYIYLKDFDNAIKYALQVTDLNPNDINAYDELSHAYGEIALQQRESHQDTSHQDKIQQYGLKALQFRNEKYTNPPLAYQPIVLPPPPSPATKSHNIISFSLFGGLPKYCETAVLNAEIAEEIYPDWSCRFYVDDSVPTHVKNRLKNAHAQVFELTQVQQDWQNTHPDFTENLTQMPQTLWRFLALDDPSIHRAIFRDADSLIGEREALAVAEWVQSGKYFHMMRDGATHTELVLAGMWGAVAGLLTQQQSFAQQIINYMQTFGDKNRHFADQFFLRDTQWTTLKTSLLQHDSQFGFLGALPFPTVSQASIDKQHGLLGKNIGIGSNISGGYFETIVTQQDGEIVTWQMQSSLGETIDEIIGEYQTPAQQGKITVFFPRMLLEKINDKILKIVLA